MRTARSRLIFFWSSDNSALSPDARRSSAASICDSTDLLSQPLAMSLILSLYDTLPKSKSVLSVIIRHWTLFLKDNPSAHDHRKNKNAGGRSVLHPPSPERPDFCTEC